MAVTKRIIQTTPDRIFAILADGWTYSDWVVGTSHIRDVDPDWPRPGSHLHHKAGPWPLSLHDKSTSLECEPDRMLLMKIRLWPLGAGHVRVTLTPVGPRATRVVMEEHFTEGPLRGVQAKINDVLLHYRNREVLRRLDDLAQHRMVDLSRTG